MNLLTVTAAILTGAVLMLASFSVAAYAANPHFIKIPQLTKNPNISLTASIKAAGLGNVVTDIFLTSSGGVADLQCVNPGGNSPPPKRVEFGPLEGETVTVQPRNGQVTAKSTIGPPPLPSAAELCPNPNWNVAILSLTYFDVVLHIQQGGQDILTFGFGDVDP